MELPQDKVADPESLLHLWLSKTRASEHELSVLCGKLLYCSQLAVQENTVSGWLG